MTRRLCWSWAKAMPTALAPVTVLSNVCKKKGRGATTLTNFGDCLPSAEKRNWPRSIYPKVLPGRFRT